jgi:hypothetical protein
MTLVKKDADIEMWTVASSTAASSHTRENNRLIQAVRVRGR